MHMTPSVLDEIEHLNSGSQTCPPSLLIHNASPRQQLPMKHTYKLGKNRQSQVVHQYMTFTVLAKLLTIELVFSFTRWFKI